MASRPLVLAFLIVVASIGAAVLSPLIRTDQGDIRALIFGLVISFSVIIAVATGLDRIADWHMKKETERENAHLKSQAELQEEAENRAVSDALTALLGLLADTHEVAFLESARRKTGLETLRAQLAQSAASAPTANGVRATYYPLTLDKDGLRELRSPKSRGRADEASTEFLERDDPGHPIWAMMSARDSDGVVYEEPDDRPRINWSAKPYKTFVSVPVHADGVVFGMLSVNAPVVGDLREVDRLTVIAMARVMSTVLAMDTGPRNLRAKREPSATVGDESGGADDA